MCSVKFDFLVKGMIPAVKNDVNSYLYAVSKILWNASKDLFTLIVLPFGFSDVSMLKATSLTAQQW